MTDNAHPDSREGYATNRSPLSPTPSTLARKTRGHFPFLSLPPEVRNEVYRFSLGLTTESMPIVRQVRAGSTNSKRHQLGVNLLRCCNQIYHEAIRYAYHCRWWQLGGRVWSYEYECWQDGRPVFDDSEYLGDLFHRTMNQIERLIVRVPVSWAAGPAPIVLKTLEKMESLVRIKFALIFCGFDFEDIGDLSNEPPVVGLVVQILSQVPKHVKVGWHGSNPDSQGKTPGRNREVRDNIRALAARFECLKGSKCSNELAARSTQT